MLRLRTLGGLSIERIDGPSISVGTTSARRRLALLAVLAAETRAVPRDRLLALFWPESDTDRARHALDQSLYALKRELKAPELFLGREELALNPAAITSDVAEFRAALNGGHNADAVELYVGPFLDGVFVSGAADVERWIDDQRMRIVNEVERAIEALATDAAARDEHRQAAEWWRRLAAMDPRKTRVIVALMSELAASGDRVSALRQAEMYSVLVRDDLDADPNPAVIALAEQLRREPQTPSLPPEAAAANACSTTSDDADDDPTDDPTDDATDGPLAGRYVIERVIGRGGASTVFLARDLRNERRVALKVLRRELGGGQGAERFRREIAVTANLQHPHILPVHEWGEADGTLYFAMPFIEGESLRERLNRERHLSVEEVASIAREVAGALAYAHERGIVHRDVKPENVLLTSGHALVADFGIARVSDAAAGGGPRRSDPGVILGTPAYLSPEQASGEFEVDARSDQYSLACVLFEALGGLPPFTAADPITLLTQRLDSEAPSIRSRRPDVPHEVDRAIARALSLNPRDRFPDIGSFAAALAVASSAGARGETDATAFVESAARRPWRSRSTLTRALVAGVPLAVALALTIAWRVARRPLAERAWIVLADVQNHTRDTIFNRALDAALLTGLQQSAYVNVLPRSRIDETLARMRRDDSSRADRSLDERTAREVAEREGVRGVAIASIDQIDSSYFVSVRVVDARTGAVLAAQRQEAKQRARIIPAIDETLRRLRADIGESADAIAKHDRPLPLATTPSLEALRNYADGLAALRVTQHQAGIELLGRAVALDPDFALAHAELGAVYYNGNNRPLGDQHYDRALQLLDRLTQREQLLIRASAESYRGNRERAIDLYSALTAEYPDDSGAWAQIGYNAMRLGRSQRALDAYRRVLAIEPRSVAALINVAVAYKQLGRFDDARDSYRRAFALEPARLLVGNVNHEFGSTLVNGGRMDEARAVYDTMLRGNAEQRAQGERSIGLLLMLRGQVAEARAHFRQAAVISQAAGLDLTQARNRLFIVAAEQELGDPWRDSIRAELATVMDLFHRRYMEPTFLLYLGKALVRNGQPAQAREVLDSLTRRAKPGNPKDQANQRTLAAEVALASGHADSAVQLLRLAITEDATAFVQESLARALALSGDRRSAAAEYEKIAEPMSHWYGWEAEPFGLVASLESGRLQEQLGDLPAARAAYQRQIERWAEPDSGLRAVREARDGLTRLGQRTK